jgi:hypothetical protein
MAEFNPWLNIFGNQQVPANMVQMGQQASPGTGVMLPPAAAAAPPPQPKQPQIVQPPPQRVPITAQRTATPPGILPQELNPQQPSMSGSYGSQLMRELETGRQNYAENVMMQQSEINKLKEGLANYASQDQGIDFTPLAALSDTWFGGNLTAAARATAPETKSQRLKNIVDMQKQIAAAQGEIPKAELEAMRTTLAQLGYAEQRAQNLEIAKINAAARKSGIMQEALIQKEAARLDRETQQLEKRIGDMTPGIVTKLQNLEDLIPGGIAGEESADVPGVGPGMFVVPDFLLGEKASDIQQNARGLAADLIKLQSGTAASDKEVDRKMKELGMSPGSKSSTFRSGVKRLKKQITVELKNKEAGFRPEAREIYKSRGGITHEVVDEIGKVSDDLEDDVDADLTQMSADQLKVWIQKHGGE